VDWTVVLIRLCDCKSFYHTGADTAMNAIPDYG